MKKLTWISFGELLAWAVKNPAFKAAYEKELAKLKKKTKKSTENQDG